MLQKRRFKESLNTKKTRLDLKSGEGEKENE